jgi:hypothetical protein
VECERQRSESIASGDTAQVEQFVAEDFLGVDPEGKQYTKAGEIADTHQNFKNYAHGHVNEVK